MIRARTEYEIVSAHSVHREQMFSQLVRGVGEYLEAGWSPCGGVSVSYYQGLYEGYQAVWRKA